jgi:hypothetical protein
MTQVVEATAETVVGEGGTLQGPPVILEIPEGNLVPVAPPEKTGKRGKRTKQTKAEKVAAEVRKAAERKAATIAKGRKAAQEDRPVESWVAEMPLWAPDHPKHDLVAGSELQGVVDAFKRFDTVERVFPIICLETVAQLYNGVIGTKRNPAGEWQHYVETHFGIYRKTGRPVTSEFTAFLTMVCGKTTESGKISKWAYSLSLWASNRSRPSPAIPEGGDRGESPFAKWLMGGHDGFGAGITGAYEAFKDTLEVSSTGTRRSRPARESRDDLIQRAQTAEAVAAQLRSRNDALEKQVDLQFEAGRSVAVADENAAAVAALGAPKPATVFAITARQLSEAGHDEDEPEALPAPETSQTSEGEANEANRPSPHAIITIRAITQTATQPDGLNDLVTAFVSRNRDLAQRFAELLTAALAEPSA